MNESKMKTFLSLRAARKEVQRSMKQWATLRLAGDDKEKRLVESTQAMFHRVPSKSILSKEDEESLHEQNTKTREFLREWTELGNQNTQDYARCAEELVRCRSMNADEALSALAKIQGEVTQILSVGLPQRSSVLANFERETGNLNDLLGRFADLYK
jgi:hypothetical protein